MQEHELGPNGGLIFCMEFLLANTTWLEEKITEISKTVH